MEQEYNSCLLTQLHNELYDILSKIINICDKYGISYFAIGGTLIGALYDSSILPWDDDLDIGMTRENYNRFLQVAPKELGKGYFLSYRESDPHTPFFYAKVKKNNTLFVEDKFKKIDMHQGIFVDVFPFDKVPDPWFMRKLQFKVVNFLKTCLMGKEVWMWKSFKQCELDFPLERSVTSTFLCWLIVSVFTKKQIYHIMLFLMSLYNKRETTHIGLVVTMVDYFRNSNLVNLQSLPFGPLSIKVASNLEEYMKYNSLRRYTSDDLKSRQNHQPLILKFSDEI